MTDPLLARDVETLRAAVAAGARPKYLCFWGHKSRGSDPGPWVLSQWYGAPFEVDGVRYATAEQWMMAGKARLFGDEEQLRAIVDARSPGQVKAIGRRVRGFDEKTWQAHRFEIVTQGNVHKFGQHSALGDYLRSTARRVLVEASPRDRVWGIGMGAENPHAEHPVRWRGLNLLGFALMEARARLAST